MPRRIQRKRVKGWRLGDAVYVGRPTRWGNPYALAWCRDTEFELGFIPRVSDKKARERVVALFRQQIHIRTAAMSDYPSDEEIRKQLAGRDLACWCPLTEPCHADVLLEIANTEVASDQ